MTAVNWQTIIKVIFETFTDIIKHPRIYVMAGSLVTHPVNWVE